MGRRRLFTPTLSRYSHFVQAQQTLPSSNLEVVLPASSTNEAYCREATKAKQPRKAARFDLMNKAAGMRTISHRIADRPNPGTMRKIYRSPPLFQYPPPTRSSSRTSLRVTLFFPASIPSRLSPRFQERGGLARIPGSALPGWFDSKEDGAGAGKFFARKSLNSMSGRAEERQGIRIIKCWLVYSPFLACILRPRLLTWALPALIHQYCANSRQLTCLSRNTAIPGLQSRVYLVVTKG